LLITGGSQGALAINRTVVDAMDRLAARKSELAIVHQTGERDYDAVRTAYARREYPAEVVPFLMNMAERFAWADVIVCRAGAITAAEIAAAGRVAVFIPFGHDQPREIERQSCAARSLARPNAARDIVNMIEEVARG
jgi:UDP-N-acetylglucosamine--N-acetylmuramyl-(pentapeptide) pyrophosphoryl-undecaprenol N-acetylglucosamine transferase